MHIMGRILKFLMVMAIALPSLIDGSLGITGHGTGGGRRAHRRLQGRMARKSHTVVEERALQLELIDCDCDMH